MRNHLSAASWSPPPPSSPQVTTSTDRIVVAPPPPFNGFDLSSQGSDIVVIAVPVTLATVAVLLILAKIFVFDKRKASQQLALISKVCVLHGRAVCSSILLSADA